jgi:hypothetical protein
MDMFDNFVVVELAPRDVDRQRYSAGQERESAGGPECAIADDGFRCLDRPPIVKIRRDRLRARRNVTTPERHRRGAAPEAESHGGIRVTAQSGLQEDVGADVHADQFDKGSVARSDGRGDRTGAVDGNVQGQQFLRQGKYGARARGTRVEDLLTK